MMFQNLKHKWFEIKFYIISETSDKHKSTMNNGKHKIKN